ncbi:MAG: FAD-binding protein [Candidatus Binatia bacterium]
MEDKTTALEADVLVLGGGLAGCNAAIGAAEGGARVVLFDKARVKYSGDGGLGIDDHTVVHWNADITPLSPIEYIQNAYGTDQNMINPRIYETFALENYDTLMRLHGYGVPFLEDDKFVFLSGSRKGGIWLKDASNLKPSLYNQVRKLGVKLVETTMATNLLVHDRRVVGATGLNVHDGSFVVCTAKTTILATGDPQRKRDPIDNYLDPANTGDGQAMAYRAGAELVNMEFVQFSAQQKNNRLMSSIGNVVHVVGPEAFVNWKGERFAAKRPGWTNMMWLVVREKMEGRGPVFVDITDLDEDTMRVVEDHNRSEGRYAIERWLRELRVDYRTCLIEVDLMEKRLDTRYAGVLTDGHCATTIGGLYAVGEVMAGGAPEGRGASIHCMTFGYHAGRHAAQNMAVIPDPDLSHGQIEAEKRRVYAPLERKTWLRHTEVSQVVNRIVNDYAGLLNRCEGNLTMGLEYLRRVGKRINEEASATNLHELVRLLELYNQVQLDEMNLLSALVRRESRFKPAHYRVDLPEENNAEWLGKVVAVKKGEEGPDFEVRVPEHPGIHDVLSDIKAARN